MGSRLSYPTVDLSGKVTVVTGGNAGIGYETAKALARMGAHTIIACRSQERATANLSPKDIAGCDIMKLKLSRRIYASLVGEDLLSLCLLQTARHIMEAIERMKEEIYQEHPERQLTVEYMQLDLASFQSTKDFTDAFKERNLPLHLLINNAGVAWVPYTVTADGYELQLQVPKHVNTVTSFAPVTMLLTNEGGGIQIVQVNHLGHFLLTLELLPTLLDTVGGTGDCRIIFVSSSAHSWANWEPGNMNAEQQYGRLKFYPNSKLYNVMTAYALQRRLQNVGITVSSLHPGIVSTDIVQGWNDVSIVKHLSTVGATMIGRSCKDGAATTINCAVNPQLNTQQALYYDSCRPVQSSTVSRNEEFQEEMWRTSIAIVEKYLSPHVLEKYGHAQIAGPSDGATLTLEGESTKNIPVSVDGAEQSHEEKQHESTVEETLQEDVQN